MDLILDWLRELDSGAVGNLISTFAALVAIAALIIESRWTRKQVKLQNFIEYTKRYQEIVLNFPENVNEHSFTFDALPYDEKSKTMRYMRAYFDLCFEEFTLHEKGFIDDDLWTIWKGGMETAYSKTAFRQAWATIRNDTQFGANFQRFVDSHVGPN